MVPPLGHACLAFDDVESFEAAAYSFLAAGRREGKRVRYVAERAPRGWDFEPELMSPAEHYPVDGVIDPATGLDTWTEATEQALADGFTGLCVVADTTRLVGTPARLDAFARYEYRVDRYMRGHPFTAMCAFDRTVVDDAVIDEMACIHPDSDAPFRLYATTTGDAGAGLAGELDAATHERFEHALDRAELEPADGEVVLEAGDLTFIDHNSLVHLDTYARRRGAVLALRTPLGVAGRMAGLLGLTALRVEITR
ncbi:MEDS domain-containing protein [Actinoplanes sp. NPDC051494]|uniref:MEDS domain-containing protein n=1 Tax=Actinoplanes sp. NPDC051494 TaxID=3363907 RepID=UPI0037AE4E34